MKANRKRSLSIDIAGAIKAAITDGLDSADVIEVLKAKLDEETGLQESQKARERQY